MQRFQKYRSNRFRFDVRLKVASSARYARLSRGNGLQRRFSTFGWKHPSTVRLEPKASEFLEAKCQDRVIAIYVWIGYGQYYGEAGYTVVSPCSDGQLMRMLCRWTSQPTVPSRTWGEQEGVAELGVGPLPYRGPARVPVSALERTSVLG